MIELKHDRIVQLTDEERQALVDVLYVVKDNWWLTELETRVLERLELGADDDEDEGEQPEQDAKTRQDSEEPAFRRHEVPSLESSLNGTLAA
jgi:hypothetical protein